MADVKKEYEDYEVVYFRRTEKEDEEEIKHESFESYQYRLQSNMHRNMMESLSFKNLSREEDEDKDEDEDEEETNPSASKRAKTLAPTSFENRDCLPLVVPCFRRIEIIGTKEEPTGTREIFDLWFPASAVDEKDQNRFSSYAQTVIKRYNKVKKTDFEFVRLVKMRWTSGHFYIRFKAKSSSAGPSATLKTFEGDVRCKSCMVNDEDGRPLSCRLIGRNFDDYLYVRPPPWYH